jgi:HEPN domain
MNGDEESERRRGAAGWLVIAREDVRVARACLSLNPPALGAAAYHCQQAAEVLVKDLLMAAAVAFRKTRDIDERADLAASNYPDPGRGTWSACWRACGWRQVKVRGTSPETPW